MAALATPPTIGNRSRMASLKGKGKASGGGGVGGLGLGIGGSGMGGDDGLILSEPRARAGLDHGQMSDAAFNRMLAEMEADRGNEKETSSKNSGDPSFPPQGYFDPFETFEWRLPRPGGEDSQPNNAQGQRGRVGVLTTGVSGTMLKSPARNQRRRKDQVRPEIEVGETVLRGRKIFPPDSWKPPPPRLAKLMGRRGTHCPIPGVCYVPPSVAGGSGASQSAKVPVYMLWHARVSRCRSAAELAVHLRSLTVAIDAEFVTEAVKPHVSSTGFSGGVGSSGRGSWSAANSASGVGEVINVLKERWNREVFQVEVLLRTLAPGRRVSGRCGLIDRRIKSSD